MPGIFRPAFQEGKREGGAPYYGKGPLYKAGDRSAPRSARAAAIRCLHPPRAPGRGLEVAGIESRPPKNKKENLAILLSFTPLERKTGLALALALRAGSRDLLSTPPTPGRGVLRSRASNPAPPEKQNRHSCDAPFLCHSGAENGTRTRAARERPRSVVYTPGPWKGRLEVAGTESRPP